MKTDLKNELTRAIEEYARVSREESRYSLIKRELDNVLELIQNAIDSAWDEGRDEAKAEFEESL